MVSRYYAKKAGDIKTAIAYLGQAIKVNPEYLPFYTLKLDYLLESDENEGYEFAWQLLEKEFKDSPITLHQSISSKLFSFYDNGTIKNPDWDLVIALNERALEVNSYELNSFTMHRDIALAYAHKKNYKTAILIIEKTIKNLENGGFDRDEMVNLIDHLTGQIRLY